ncbi:MAG: Fur family transcriptional regulator [Candidatus Cloacimonas sp.]|nr:transcriptional repressor [Candidatus Cloacimonadota bacterium]
MDYREVFINYLKKNDLQLTKSREIILDAVFETHSHFEIEELYQMLRYKNKKVSRATVYRTIPYLVEAGLVRRLRYSDQNEQYEHIYGHPNHFHLHCLNCDRVIEQNSPELEKNIEKLAKRLNFKIQDYSVSISGHCSLCEEKETERIDINE